MSEYLNLFDEKTVEIQNNFNYDGFQVVKKELFNHSREAAITIRSDSIVFNNACIAGLEDTVFIHIMVSPDRNRIVIRKCNEDDKDSLRWCVARNNVRKSRVIKGRFSAMIYSMMNWAKGYRYKILGHKITYKDETLYVFELDECEIYKERVKRTKAEKEEREKTLSPEQIREEDRQERMEARKVIETNKDPSYFGVGVEEHQNTIQLGDLDFYQGVSTLANEVQGI